MPRIPRATDTDGLLLGDLAPGARVGEYVVEAVLATRGTGHVYEATHRVLPRRVHIKVIPAAQGSTQALSIELLREACIVDALDHPGIPRIYECGALPDRRPWIATELVEGVSLATRCELEELPLRDAAAIVRDVADILDHAHARGLVHRNVIPQAIVFPTQRRRFPVCVVDWSGARTRDSRTPLPMVAQARSRPYLAPEHARGIVDERADIYSLGVIARELLRRADPDRRPPIFAALVKTMTSPDPAERPTASSVREHAAWLVDEIDREAAGIDPAIPEPIPHERTEVSRVVMSDVTPEITGEIET